MDKIKIFFETSKPKVVCWQFLLWKNYPHWKRPHVTPIRLLHLTTLAFVNGKNNGFTTSDWQEIHLCLFSLFCPVILSVKPLKIVSPGTKFVKSLQTICIFCKCWWWHKICLNKQLCWNWGLHLQNCAICCFFLILYIIWERNFWNGLVYNNPWGIIVHLGCDHMNRGHPDKNETNFET